MEFTNKEMEKAKRFAETYGMGNEKLANILGNVHKSIVTCGKSQYLAEVYGLDDNYPVVFCYVGRPYVHKEEIVEIEDNKYYLVEQKTFGDLQVVRKVLEVQNEPFTIRQIGEKHGLIKTEVVCLRDTLEPKKVTWNHISLTGKELKERDIRPKLTGVYAQVPKEAFDIDQLEEL
ncbi:hypothetical protein ACQUY5_16800 [Bacillus cereus]|uniref:hypothetical protein n=1 Tax=Bacillus cereus TaxID=1396 RepID=UPI003D174F1B